jgi:hypothetical protein
MLAISVDFEFTLARKSCWQPGTVAEAVAELYFLTHFVTFCDDYSTCFLMWLMVGGFFT